MIIELFPKGCSFHYGQEICVDGRLLMRFRGLLRATADGGERMAAVAANDVADAGVTFVRLSRLSNWPPDLPDLPPCG